MKKSLFSSAAALVTIFVLLMAAGCSGSNNDDARGLLETVPADASMVAVVNIHSITDALGCKNDGNGVTLSDKVRSALDSLDGKDKTMILDLLSGDAGVATNALVAFSAARSYVTGLLNDPDKFVAYMQQHGFNGNPAQVEEEDGVRIIGNAAVIGNQFWFCRPGRPDASQVKYYQKLSSRQSYASSDVAGRLLDKDEAVTFIGDVEKVVEMAGAPSQLRLAVSLMFEDAAYIGGVVSVDKKGADIETSVLNSKLSPAKFLLPTRKIDADLIRQLSPESRLYMAAGVSADMVRKILELAKGFAMALPSEITSGISQIDGTLALCGNERSNLQIKMQTDGKDFASLSAFAQTMGFAATRDGDTVTLTKGDSDYGKGCTSEKAASALKGAWFGVSMADAGGSGADVTMRAEGEKGGMKVNLRMEGDLTAMLEIFL